MLASLKKMILSFFKLCATMRGQFFGSKTLEEHHMALLEGHHICNLIFEDQIFIAFRSRIYEYCEYFSYLNTNSRKV